MTTSKRLSSQDVYDLIPSVYRLRDAQNGYVLKALADVIHSEGVKVEDNISQLYDDWFIDTCQEWVVPYIGELLGISGLQDIEEAAGVSRRAFVANTIGYRRRKGTIGVLEQLAYDITGWRSIAVEFFSRLGWTQNMNHVKPGFGGPVSLKSADTLELTGSPFDKLTHTADVRSVEVVRGFDNIENIGLFLWRIPAYRVYNSEVRSQGSPGCFHIHPWQTDAPLYNPPLADTGITDLTDERNVPVPLRSRPLYHELENRRQAVAANSHFSYLYFDDRDESVSEQAFELILDGTVVPPEKICVCDLSGWTRPEDTKDYIVTENDGTTSTISMPIAAAIDPVLGRLTLPGSATATDIRMSYSFGWPGDIGAGTYNRQTAFDNINDRDITWHIGVSKTDALLPGEIVGTVSDAVSLWNAQPAGTVGVISIMDNSIFTENLTDANSINIPEGSRLFIVAGQWPRMPVMDSVPGHMERQIGQLVLDQTRASFVGNMSITGTAPFDSELGGEFFLNGISIQGNVLIESGNLSSVRVDHCTSFPSKGGISIGANNQDLSVFVNRSVTGRISTTSSLEQIQIEDSVVQGNVEAILAENCPITVLQSTILGTCRCLNVTASSSIFNARLVARRKQVGCIRYSYVEPTSQTPRKFRCQPDMAVRDLPASEHDAVEALLHPSFTSTDEFNPAYCQLSRTCAQEIKQGGEGGTEMGAWNMLEQPCRFANLRAQIDEYIRFGMKLGIESAT